jgi:EmrB/QacA subfamily drug resistance transporter
MHQARVRLVTKLTPVIEAGFKANRVRTPIFLVTSLGAFMGSLDLSIVNVAFPALERSFSGDTTAALAWVITAYSITYGSLLVIAGRTADRIGSRKFFNLGLSIFCLGSALCALAPSVPFLIAGRVIQGSGAAAMLPASLSLLLAAYPHERRTQIVSLWGGIGALAVATGPTLGATLVTVGGWRWVFLVNLPVGAFAYFMGRRVLSEGTINAHHPAPDYLGAAFISGALATLVLAITQGPSWGRSSARVIGTLAASFVLGNVFLYRCHHHREPVLDLTLFRARSFSVTNVATLLYSMGFFAILLGNILFLTSVWHYQIIWAGLAVTSGPLVVASVAGPAGRLAARVGFRPVLLAGTSIFTLGLLSFALRVGLHPEYLTRWLPATILLGLGIGLTFPVLGATAVSSLQADRYAVGSAVNQTARQVGGAIGVALLVVILGTPHSVLDALTNFHHLWFFSASMAAAAGLTCCFLAKGRQRIDEKVSAVGVAEASVDL